MLLNHVPSLLHAVFSARLFLSTKKYLIDQILFDWKALLRPCQWVILILRENVQTSGPKDMRSFKLNRASVIIHLHVYG